MPQASRKILWAVLAVAVILLGIAFFVYQQRKDLKRSCNNVLYEPLKKHIIPDMYNEFVGAFSDVWVSKSIFLLTKCSFFTMKPDGSSAQEYRNNTGDLFMTYGEFKREENGVISIHPENDLNVTTGQIYPIYFSDFVLGNVICEENDGKPQWKSVISVRNDMLHHNKTPSLVNEAVKTFTGLGTDVGLSLGDGEMYTEPCYEDPVWRDETKNSSY